MIGSPAIHTNYRIVGSCTHNRIMTTTTTTTSMMVMMMMMMMMIKGFAVLAAVLGLVNSSSARMTSLSNTPNGYRCLMHGRFKGSKFAIAIMKASTTVKGQLEIHRKLFESESDAKANLEADLIDTYCPLTLKQALEVDLRRLFLTKGTPSYIRTREEELRVASSRFMANWKKVAHLVEYSEREDDSETETPSRRKVDTNHLIAQVYKGQPEALVRAADETAIVMHKDTYQMIEAYATKGKHQVAEVISSFITDRLIASNPASKSFIVPRMEEDGSPILLPEDWNIGNYYYMGAIEMLLSYLLMIISPTRFISDCRKKNLGNIGKPGTFFTEGYIATIPGARSNDYNRLRLHLYKIHRRTKEPEHTSIIEAILWDYLFTGPGIPWYTFKEVEEMDMTERNKRYFQDDDDYYIDKLVLGRLLPLTIVPFLLDANRRAWEAEKLAYLVIIPWEHVGIEEVFLKIFFNTLKDLYQKDLIDQISHIRFDGVDDDDVIEDLINDNRKYFPTIKLIYNDNVPGPASHIKEIPDPENMALFIAIPSHGLAYSGNTYWMNPFGVSSDYLAQCSTYAEIQNPDINQNFMYRFNTYSQI